VARVKPQCRHLFELAKLLSLAFSLASPLLSFPLLSLLLSSPLSSPLLSPSLSPSPRELSKTTALTATCPRGSKDEFFFSSSFRLLTLKDPLGSLLTSNALAVATISPRRTTLTWPLHHCVVHPPPSSPWTRPPRHQAVWHRDAPRPPPRMPHRQQKVPAAPHTSPAAPQPVPQLCAPGLVSPSPARSSPTHPSSPHLSTPQLAPAPRHPP
jgi:hypothetical protein